MVVSAKEGLGERPAAPSPARAVAAAQKRPQDSTLASIKFVADSIVIWIAFFVVEGYRCFVEPVLVPLGVVSPGFGDATYGRARLPRAIKEQELIYDNPAVTATERVVPLEGEALRKGGSWDRSGKNFVSYSIWQVDEAMKRENLNSDIVLLHGINNYAGRQADTGLILAQHGFRVIALDFPSFGRSSGLHSYLPSLRILIEALHTVLNDIRQKDTPEMKDRKIFLQGESMGGFTALYYAALYPPLPQDKSHAEMRDMRPNIAGVACCAPMLAIASTSRPSATVEKIARFIALLAGRLPFSPGVKGNVSDDIRVEIEFHEDAQTYKGWLRIATGLAILSGLQELWELAPQITVPVMLNHGKNDRATSHTGTQAFFEKISSKDKSFRIWNGYEHIMLKNVRGQSKDDDRKRMDVLNEMIDFYKTRARGTTMSSSNATEVQGSL